MINPGEKTVIAGKGTLTGVKGIAAGLDHSLAVTTDGRVLAWGSNAEGQLGYAIAGTTDRRSAPVIVPGFLPFTHLANMEAVAAGAYFSVALSSGGNVWTWGDNSRGQLGHPATIGNPPTALIRAWPAVDGSGQFVSGVVAVAAGYEHALALKSDGTVWAWGDNRSGELGDSAAGQMSSHAVEVVGPGGTGALNGIRAIAAGDGYSLALSDDGTVWAWGANGAGELGSLPVGGAKATPVAVAGPGGGGTLLDAIELGTGCCASHTLVVAAPVAAQMPAQLASQLVPSGPAAKIRALLKAGRYATSFKAPSAGRVSIGWYYLPKGAELSSAHKPKPQLIASGTAKAAKASRIKLTMKLTTGEKRMLRQARTLRLTAKGVFTPANKRAVVTTRTFRLVR